MLFRFSSQELKFYLPLKASSLPFPVGLLGNRALKSRYRIAAKKLYKNFCISLQLVFRGLSSGTHRFWMHLSGKASGRYQVWREKSKAHQAPASALPWGVLSDSACLAWALVDADNRKA